MDDDADYNDVFNDFATDDFITKNIRVRPTSGVTHADETRDGRQSNVSRNVSGADGGDTKGGDDENQALYHLNLDRKNIKNLYQQRMEEIRKKEEAKAKENEKRR